MDKEQQQEVAMESEVSQKSVVSHDLGGCEILMLYKGFI